MTLGLELENVFTNESQVLMEQEHNIKREKSVVCLQRKVAQLLLRWPRDPGRGQWVHPSVCTCVSLALPAYVCHL